jgi:hypothetical protein
MVLYFGNGEHDPSASTGWHLNSGNIIVKDGFDDRDTPIVGVGVDGIFLRVHERGDLLWYQYIGMGEADSLGAHHGLFFDGNSGHRIGIGWGSVKHITVYPLFGPEGLGAHQIFVVQRGDDEGKLSWYGYMGNGETDAVVGGENRWLASKITSPHIKIYR